MNKKNKIPLRSKASYGKKDRDGFIHRSWMKSQGLPEDAFDGRPVIGICNTWSELTPCNTHLRNIAEYVKRGVWEAGGLPLEFPAMSLGETQMRPTTMLFRNLLAMEVEESIRGNPIDGVVLLGGCDKTTPAQLMGAASVDLPTAVISSGPMLSGRFRGGQLGSGTDVWRLSEDVRAGKLSEEEFMQAEAGMSRSHGTCMTMGSASTMACIVEAMGLALPGNATTPGVEAGRQRIGHLTGRAIVELVEKDLRFSHFVTRNSLENALRVHAAIGGSTNTIIHLLALAGRYGLPLELDDFDELGQGIPLLVDIEPSGKYLMEDFHYAGGLQALQTRIRHLLHDDIPTIGGPSSGALMDGAEVFIDDVIRPLDAPVNEDSGVWVLRGNLCPDGAVIKSSAASKNLLKHRGKAVVFETIEDFKARIDADDLDVDEESILVLKGCGPKGYPGMPEVGNMPLPGKLLEKGVRDMVRISDARMSGTAFGTVVLHVAPESTVGGPLNLVQTGDEIELDGPGRSLTLLVDDDELARRAEQQVLPESKYDRGYYKLHIDHVMQADTGCDLDFLVGGSGSVVDRESH